MPAERHCHGVDHRTWFWTGCVEGHRELMSADAPQSMRIRPAGGNDAPLLTALALRSKAYWGYTDEFIAACREELTYTKEQIEAPQNFGYIYLSNELPIAFYVLEQTDVDVAELDALFVEPEYIGKGIGKKLIEHAKEQAEKLGIATIVIQGDPNAEPFYVAIGALPCGTRESGSIPGRQLPLFMIKLQVKQQSTQG
jgi:GNAT superfamily N-acetyltransferase